MPKGKYLLFKALLKNLFYAVKNIKEKYKYKGGNFLSYIFNCLHCVLN